MDNDLWGHLFFGREILQARNFPTRNLYSYTAPDAVWINHEWLAEVIFYGIYRLLGSPGLLLLKVVPGGGIVWLVNLMVRERRVSPVVHVLTLIWTMALLSPGFNVRPQIFSYFLFALLLFVLCRSERKGPAILCSAPVLTALWANLHGGFVAGLGAMGVFSLWALIRRYGRGRPADAAVRPTLIALLLSLFSVVLNPYGVSLLEFLWEDLLLDRPITEWRPIPLLDLSFLELKFAVLFVFLSVRRDSWRSWRFVVALAAAWFAFRHQRHTPLFAVAAAPLMAEGIERAIQWVRRDVGEIGRRSPLRELFAAGLLGVALAQLGWMGRIHLEHRLQLVVHPSRYPTQAVDFLKRNGVRGNVAVPFDWGEYLIWKLYPEIRVSIDGRYTTAYPMEVIEDSWEWMRGGRGWARYLERYPAEIAVTKRDHPVTALLLEDARWVYVYSDPIAFVFVREDTGKGTLLERFRMKGLLPPGRPPLYFPG